MKLITSNSFAESNGLPQLSRETTGTNNITNAIKGEMFLQFSPPLVNPRTTLVTLAYVRAPPTCGFAIEPTVGIRIEGLRSVRISRDPAISSSTQYHKLTKLPKMPLHHSSTPLPLPSFESNSINVFNF